MPGMLNHSPADVLSRILIALGVGSTPGDGMAWPIGVDSEPTTPDACITIYDTAGRLDGRTQDDGEVQDRPGVQVRLRSATHPQGYPKARAVAIALDSIYGQTASLDGSTYCVHCVNRSTDVIRLGKELAASKRSLFTINALTLVSMTAG